jgi:hypothetical protein
MRDHGDLTQEIRRPSLMHSKGAPNAECSVQITARRITLRAWPLLRTHVELAELDMPNPVSKAVFFGYTLIAELDPLPNENGERFWRARVVDHRGMRMNFPRAAGWASQAEAEEHAESIARCSALRKGIEIGDYKPRWTLI